MGFGIVLLLHPIETWQDFPSELPSPSWHLDDEPGNKIQLLHYDEH